ncbi:response regulator [Alkaliphilus transvaalensis]|uniref:response regulator n=1 Tax=Alkaliphilus transvaalensis TaxID=114628 RepID=UPI00047B6EAC|nr:response regulator [Alkaliphilus transvaalensis]
MDLNIYIIDDDISIRHILKDIITSRQIGNIVGESDNGQEGLRDILLLKPDIVIIDLLLPFIDGIELVSSAKTIKEGPLFIMISQVSAKDMVVKAYEEGIEYFINKPINVNEVVSILKKVIEKYKLTRALKHIESAFSLLGDMKGNKIYVKEDTAGIKERIKLNLSHLGILGETGSKDIVEMATILANNRIATKETLPRYKTSEIYKLLSDLYREEKRLEDASEKAIEQRVRRAIGKALRNIASLGLEDYGDLTFNTYANTLFDFQEVRMEMDFLKGKSKYRGKINVKKFIEGVILFANQRE